MHQNIYGEQKTQTNCKLDFCNIFKIYATVPFWLNGVQRPTVATTHVMWLSYFHFVFILVAEMTGVVGKFVKRKVFVLNGVAWPHLL